MICTCCRVSVVTSATFIISCHSKTQNGLTFRYWVEIWDWCKVNKRHAIYSSIGTVTQNKHIFHRDAVIINRLQISPSRLTHSCLLSGEDHPICEPCRLPLTVNHILVECPQTQNICQILHGLFFKRPISEGGFSHCYKFY